MIQVAFYPIPCGRCGARFEGHDYANCVGKRHEPQPEPPRSNRRLWALLVVAYIALLLFCMKPLFGAEPATAERPDHFADVSKKVGHQQNPRENSEKWAISGESVTALQAETQRTLEELAASARANAEAVAALPPRATIPKPRDLGLCEVGLYNTIAPIGDYLAQDVAVWSNDLLPQPPKRVQVSVTIGKREDWVIKRWDLLPDVSMNVWIEARSREDVPRLLEEALRYGVAGEARRTLEPEEGE